MLLPAILLERGECTFAAKVRNAEAVGAAAVFIIDNKLEDNENIVMSDDGVGHSISIPSFLLRRDAGQSIKAFSELSETSSIESERHPVVLRISTDIHMS